MPRVFRRETFIALRARRQAYAIAQDVLNPHVDVTALPCPHCGADVPVAADNLAPRAPCPSCGESVMLPGNYFADVQGSDDVPDYEPVIVREGIHWGVCILLGLFVGTLFMLLAFALSS